MSRLAGVDSARAVRAEARDFADVYALAQRYDTRVLLDRAAQIDPGFDPTVLATMLGSLGRFTDEGSR